LLEYSNYNIIKEQIKTNEDIETILKKNNDKINFNGIETLFQQNKNEIEVKALDDIENLAFISTKFLENMNGFRKGNGNNININGNDKEIAIKNGQALLEINDQICCFDLQENNLNKQKNKEIFDIPEGLNKNEFLKDIKESKEKNNLKDVAKKKLTPRITIEKDVSLGLDNVGATCYMNATLQCLAHIKKISDHIVNYKRNKKLTDAKKYKLTKAYAEVVNGIWFPEEGKRSFAPNEFKKVIGEMNSLFAPTAANDAKDLLIFLIEQMHNELNKTKETNLALIMPDNMDPTNQQQVFQCFAQEFTKKYNSVFSTYCYGSNTSMTLCHGCNIAKYSFQCFSFIIFPLLEAKNHRNYLISCGSLPPQLFNQPLNIEDCFNYYQKIEFFTGDNQMYCNYCRQMKNASMCTQIYYAPLVLILVLNRGRGNRDFQEKFVFWETINLFNYVQYKMPDNTYFLSGIITHLGESGEGGHFIAFCRMSKDSKWYCYNDSMVNESNFNEINNKGTPYILFYQKIIME
jgi:ubiquitin C-terminal hydrolase